MEEITSLPSACPLSHGLWLRGCPFPISSLVVTDRGLTLLQGDLILAHDICNSCFQMRSLFEVLGVRIDAWDFGKTQFGL